MTHPLLSNARSTLPEALEALRTIVEHTSGTEDAVGVGRVQDWLAAKLACLGFDTTVWHEGSRAFGPHLYACQLTRVPPRVLLLGHADTAHRDDPSDPFPFTVDDRRAYGPGVADMKGGLIVAVEALRLLRALGRSEPEVAVLVTPDEEVGSPLSRGVIPRYARAHTAVLNLEPARPTGDVVVARKGSAHLTVVAHGRSAHAGLAPQDGANAIDALASLIVHARTLADVESGTTLNVGTVRGGTATNVVPAWAEARIHVGAWSADNLAGAIATIRRACAAPAVPGTRLELAEGGGFPPMERTEAVDRLLAEARAAAQEVGIALEATSTAGAADAGHVAAAGVPVLCGLGPVGGGLHSRDEYVEISSLAERAAVLACLLDRLLGPPPTDR